jgi:hypothetical protein
MIKMFGTYCAIIVTTLAFANYQGYVLTSLFSSSQAANKSANRFHK